MRLADELRYGGRLTALVRTTQQPDLDLSEGSRPTKCPFVYSDGRQCSGEIWQAQAYGPRRFDVIAEQDVRKIRLWCSEKGDHVGAVKHSGLAQKERMEFYLDDLARRGLLAEAIAMCGNVRAYPRRLR